MYAKLVLRNAKRSAKDYLIYLVTMTICVALFYSFLSISSSDYHPDIGTEYDFEILGNSMKMAICAVTLLLLFLIRYVNHYMLIRRQKEFAVQSVMGMEQKTIGLLFFAETFIMGLAAIAFGIFFGVFGSQFITAMLLRSYGKSYRICWTLFPDTVFWTFAFFGLSFLFVGLFNLRTIRKVKVIDMLSAERKNEPSLKKSRQMPVIVVLYELLTLLMLFDGIKLLHFYFDKRFVFPVHLMFWGNILTPAVTLLWQTVWFIWHYIEKCSLGRRSVCKARSGAEACKAGFPALLSGMLLCAVLNAVMAARVPVMQNRYYLALGTGVNNRYMTFLLVDLLFGICAVIYLASRFMEAWKESSPEHKYHNQNLFFWGQIMTKLSTTNKTMTLICITLVLAIFLFMAAPVLVGWAYGYLEMRSRYDVQIFSDYCDVYEEEALPHDDYSLVTEFLTQHGIETEYDCTFALYLPEKADFHNRIKYDFPVAAVSLSDYNKIRQMLGYETISLGEHEFTTQWNAVVTGEERELFLQTHEELVTDAGNLTLSEQAFYLDALGETIYNSYTDVLFVVPDDVCENLLPVMWNRYIKTTETISYADASALETFFESVYPESAENGAGYGIRMSTLQINGTKADMFVLQAAMLYGGIVLMVICLTILSLQQLLDAGQYRYRFSILQKLGVEEKDIERLVLKQLGVWFGLPVTVAVVAAVVIVTYFICSVSAQIAAYIGFGVLFAQILMTGGILVFLLGCYFGCTWVLFERSVM